MYEDFTQNRITQLRIQKNVSARDMSLSLGQNGSYINQIENKRALPSMQVFFYICEYFKITPKEFFDDGTDNPALINGILENLKHLNHNSLSCIEGITNELAAKN